MYKTCIGEALDYPFGGAVLWLDRMKGLPFPLLLWKTGPVMATIAKEDEPVPEDRYYVRVACLEGPVRPWSPLLGGPSDEDAIGEEGDLVEVYRAGQRQVRFIIWPGRFRDWEKREIRDRLPDFEDSCAWPADIEVGMA